MLKLIVEDELIEIISNLLVRNYGFKEKDIRKNYSIKDLSWTPDLYAVKGHEKWAIEVKTIKSFPDVIIQQISNELIKEKSPQFFIATTPENIKFFRIRCKKYGIGLLEISKNKLKLIISPFKRSIKKPIKNFRPNVFYIFLSSKAELKERIEAKKNGKVFEDMYSPHKIVLKCHEYTSYSSPNKVWLKIKEDINKSHGFIGILNGEYRRMVDKEIKYAFRKWKGNKKRIKIMVKTMDVKNRDKKQNKLIQYIQNNIKHSNYDGISDFSKRFGPEFQSLVITILPKSYSKR